MFPAVLYIPYVTFANFVINYQFFLCYTYSLLINCIKHMKMPVCFWSPLHPPPPSQLTAAKVHYSNLRIV
jgi:hypothetical protein